jgi:hypothetical protein
MSHFLDRLKFLSADKEEFSDGHGVTVGEDRTRLCARPMAPIVRGHALGKFT